MRNICYLELWDEVVLVICLTAFGLKNEEFGNLLHIRIIPPRIIEKGRV